MPLELARYLPKNKDESLRKKFSFGIEIPCKNLVANTGCTLVSATDQLHLLETGLLHPSSRDLNACANTRIRLHAQLWAEEAKCIVDLLSFAKEGVQIECDRRFNHYKVPAEGVSEKRPSVLRGDVIHVRIHGVNSDHWDAGYVHFVNMDSVVANFDPRSSVAQALAKSQEGVKFDVVFCDEDRTQWRVQHRAIDEGFFLDRQAIEDIRKPSGHARRNDLQLHMDKNMQKLMLNPEQAKFVDDLIQPRVTRGLHIIHGPPGTGKTSTCCAALAALLCAFTNVRILVCCPSNASADLIVERLSDYPVIRDCNIEMLRIHAMSRAQKDASDRVNLYSLPNGTGGYTFPTGAASLVRYSVIVSTLSTTGKLFGIGVPTDFFTHVFVDEAGQATEAQMMLATTFLRNKQTAFIMAGDHLQLGPVIHAGACKEAGMNISPLERLCTSASADCITHLVRNYRSHPDILRIVNVPYKDKLIAARKMPANWNPSFLHPKYGVLSNGPPAVFANRDWRAPLVFCHIQGKEERELDSPSWKNEDEISCVTGLVKQLIHDHNEDPRNIVVLTPYILQRQRIDQRLFGMFHRDRSIRLRDDSLGLRFDGKPFNPIECATIEAFQGKERKIVIVSCVRSREDEVKTDVRHFLGFLSQPNRSNVALSRAQDFLIVVGNAKLLLTEGMRKLHDAPRATKVGDEVHFGGGGNWNMVMERFLQMKAVINVGAPATPPEELFKKAYEMAHEDEKKREQKRQAEELKKMLQKRLHVDPNDNDDDDDSDESSDEDEIVQSAPWAQLE